VASAVGKGAYELVKAGIRNPKTTIGLATAGTFGAGVLATSPTVRSKVGSFLTGAPKSVYLAGRNLGGVIEGTEQADSSTLGTIGKIATGSAILGAGIYAIDKIIKNNDEEILIDTPVTAPDVLPSPSGAVIGDNPVTGTSEPSGMVTETPARSRKRKKKTKTSASPMVRLTNNNYINIKNNVKGWSY